MFKIVISENLQACYLHLHFLYISINLRTYKFIGTTLRIVPHIREHIHRAPSTGDAANYTHGQGAGAARQRARPGSSVLSRQNNRSRASAAFDLCRRT